MRTPRPPLLAAALALLVWVGHRPAAAQAPAGPPASLPAVVAAGAVGPPHAAAERALTAGPFSVVHKTRLPPSGDTHDFLTLAPYWWPDPAVPGGLPYIRRDGEVNPESKRDTDDVPFSQMTSAVTALATAFRETGDRRFAERAAFLLRTWFLDAPTRMNPNLDYGQGIPGRVTGRGAGIIATRALVNVLDAARAIEPDPSWTDADRAGLRAWCSDYAAWLTTSRNGRDEANARNNHGTWYEAQLAALLLYTGQRQKARARLETTTRRLGAQIEPDGRQPLELARTRAWSYSVMNLEGWFTLARLGREAGVDLWSYRTADGRSLRAALDYLVPFADGAPWPHPQITPFDAEALAPLLERAASPWGEPRYQALAARLRSASRRGQDAAK